MPTTDPAVLTPPATPNDATWIRLAHRDTAILPVIATSEGTIQDWIETVRAAVDDYTITYRRDITLLTDGGDWQLWKVNGRYALTRAVLGGPGWPQHPDGPRISATGAWALRWPPRVSHDVPDQVWKPVITAAEHVISEIRRNDGRTMTEVDFRDSTGHTITRWWWVMAEADRLEFLLTDKAAAHRRFHRL